MNKTFKVIFSRARGAFVAVNEAAKTTSRASVKTAVAAALLAVSVGASATAVKGVVWNSAEAPELTADAIEMTGQEVVNSIQNVGDNYYAYLNVQAGASGVLNDVSINLKASGPVGTNKADKQIFGIEQTGGKVTLGGSILNIAVETDLIGGGNNQATALAVYKAEMVLDAEKVSLSVVSKAENGKSVYGLSAGGTVTVNSKALDISLSSATDRGHTDKNNNYSETIGIDVYKGVFTTADDTVISIKASTSGTTATRPGKNNEEGTTPLTGVKLEGGQVNAPGTVNVDLTTVAGKATGVAVTNFFYNTSQGENRNDSAGILNDLSVAARSESGEVYGISSTASFKDNTQNSIVLTVDGNADLAVQSNSGKAYGIALLGTSTVTLKGDASVSAKSGSSGTAYSVYVDKGKLNFSGKNVTLTGDMLVNKDGQVDFAAQGGKTVLAGSLSGAGALNVSSDFTLSGTVEAFTGDVVIDDGTTTLTAANKYFGGNVTVNGGKLIAPDVTKVTLAGGTLETGSAQVYNLGTKSVINEDAAKVTSAKDLDGLALKTGITATNGTLALTDEGFYTTASLKAMSEALKGGSASLSFLNSKLYKAAGETAELVDSVIQSTEQVTASSAVTTDADGKATAKVTVKNSGAQTVVVKDSAETGAKAVDQVTFTAPENSTGEMTLVGSAAGGHLVQNTAGKAVDVIVEKGLTLNLGQTELPGQTTGTLANLTLSEAASADKASLAVNNIVAVVDTLKALGKNLVTVGNAQKRAALKIGTLHLGEGSKVFLDPAWQDDAALNTIGKASHLEIAQVGSLKGSLIAGQNSLITIGATAAQAEAAFNQAGQTWGKDAVTAALYLGTSVNPEGGILVDGSLTEAGKASATSGTVTLTKGSMLMVDAAAVGEKAVTGTVKVLDDAKIALVNAAEGTFTLADHIEGQGLTSESFVSDNLFTTTALKGTSVTTTVDKEALGGAVASMGLQSMIRRADSVLAATVADRTSIDQELGAGANLWVDVGGESYEADDFDNNGKFKSDMGYGVFGADVAVSDDITLGAALQYGTGSARSSNFSLKNEIDTWGLTAYSVYKKGDARFVGEVAYVKAKNDISASAASKLSQSVDTEMLSAGMSAHYQFDAGAVTVTPSLGIRLSQLKTDALKVGGIRIADDEMTVFQVPVAVRVGMKPVEASGWNIAPVLKLAYVPTFGDDETDILGYQQKVLDTSPVQADIGVAARKGNFMVNVNFLAGTGSEGAKAVGGKVGVKYLF